MTQREQYKQAEHDTAIPKVIEEISISRNPYNDSVRVFMKAPFWTTSFQVSEEHLFPRIHEIAAEMEKTPR